MSKPATESDPLLKGDTMSKSKGIESAVYAAGVDMAVGGGDDKNSTQSALKWILTHKQSFMEFLTLGWVAAIWVCYLFGFVVSSGISLFVAGIYNMCLTPIVLIQRYFLSQQETLRRIENELRGQVNEFKETNDKLTSEVDELEAKVDHLHKVESDLMGLVGSQGHTVNAIVDLVKENGKVLDEMQKECENEVLQQILTIVLQSDRNQDFTLEDNEVNMLLLRIKALPAVENVDEDEIRKMIQDAHGSVMGLTGLIQNMYKKDEEAKNKLIHVSSRKLVESKK